MHNFFHPHAPSSTNMVTVQDSVDMFTWPFTAPTATTTAQHEVKIASPNTPYQPHNGYQQHRIRKRIFVTLVCMSVALLSLVLSVVLYVTVGLGQDKGGWAFRTWMTVSSAGVFMAGVFMASFVCQYRMEKRVNGKPGCEAGIALKRLGKRKAEDAPSIARAPLVSQGLGVRYVENEFADYPTPKTVIQRCSAQASPCRHNLTKKSTESTKKSAITSETGSRPPSPLLPPPVKPDPVAIAAAKASMEERNNRLKNKSPASKASMMPLEQQLSRTDSLKQMREAKLRRKQAFEQLNGQI